MQTYTFHVNGMHCSACVVLIESELADVSGVRAVKASLSKLSVEVTGAFAESVPEQVARMLSRALEPHGYSLSVQAVSPQAAWSEFAYALPIALVFVALFVLLQKLGIVNFISSSSVTYGTAFVIGVIASVSTCMAVVGGLLLSMSAQFAKGGERIRPQLLFHLGRLLSFFVLGGAIGALGSAFQLGAMGTAVVSFLIALVMISLGIHLLDVFPLARRFQLVLPTGFGARIHALKKVNHTLTPFVVGIATFFLPCGFTQSMQIYALSTGSYLTGALLMTFFALGTLPVLALISFSSLSIRDHARAGIFFKTAGLIVIFFGIFNLINSMVGAGIIPPLYNF